MCVWASVFACLSAWLCMCARVCVCVCLCGLCGCRSVDVDAPLRCRQPHQRTTWVPWPRYPSHGRRSRPRWKRQRSESPATFLAPARRVDAVCWCTGWREHRVWTLAAEDSTLLGDLGALDDGLADEDDLLAGDVLPATAASAAADGGCATKRRACANCSCGCVWHAGMAHVWHGRVTLGCVCLCGGRAGGRRWRKRRTRLPSRPCHLRTRARVATYVRSWLCACVAMECGCMAGCGVFSLWYAVAPH